MNYQEVTMNHLNRMVGVVAALIQPASARTELSTLPPELDSTGLLAPVGFPTEGVIARYGPHDPVLDAKRFIWRCPCGSRPVLIRSANTGSRLLPVRHFIRCSACGRKGPPGERSWEAVVGWNRTYPDANTPLESFPFFALQGLSPREVRRKLLGVRAELERWRAAVGQAVSTRQIRRHDGEHIDAYLRWTIVAQALATTKLRIEQIAPDRVIALPLPGQSPTSET